MTTVGGLLQLRTRDSKQDRQGSNQAACKAELRLRDCSLYWLHINVHPACEAAPGLLLLQHGVNWEQRRCLHSPQRHYLLRLQKLWKIPANLSAKYAPWQKHGVCWEREQACLCARQAEHGLLRPGRSSLLPCVLQ